MRGGANAFGCVEREFVVRGVRAASDETRGRLLEGRGGGFRDYSARRERGARLENEEFLRRTRFGGILCVRSGAGGGVRERGFDRGGGASQGQTNLDSVHGRVVSFGKKLKLNRYKYGHKTSCDMWAEGLKILFLRQ